MKKGVIDGIWPGAAALFARSQYSAALSRPAAVLGAPSTVIFVMVEMVRVASAVRVAAVGDEIVVTGCEVEW